MPEKPHLNELAERKRLLILEADLHRTIIGVECRGLRSRVESLNGLRGQISAKRPWFIGGGALAGLMALRHWRKLLRWAPQAFAIWRVFKKKRTRR
jgi:hypothetical protein